MRKFMPCCLKSSLLVVDDGIIRTLMMIDECVCVCVSITVHALPLGAPHGRMSDVWIIDKMINEAFKAPSHSDRVVNTHLVICYLAKYFTKALPLKLPCTFAEIDVDNHNKVKVPILFLQQSIGSQI